MNSWQISLNDPTTRVEGMEELAQSIYLLLATVKGSDPLRPGFGSDLYLYLDKPLAEYQHLLVYSIIDAVDKWEKRVKITRCQVAQDRIGTLTIALEMELKATGEQAKLTVNI